MYFRSRSWKPLGSLVASACCCWIHSRAVFCPSCWICCRKASFLEVTSWTEGMGRAWLAMMTASLGMTMTMTTQAKSRTRKLVEDREVRAETNRPRLKKTDR